MRDMGTCTSETHLSRAYPAEEREEIEWRDATGRTRRVRVRNHTCPCSTVHYELCQAAGLMFIRRRHERTVQDSPWSNPSEVERLWTRLLAGTAR